MKKILAWFLLLNKRLYKKITFVCILLMIPVLVGVFQVVAQQPSGVVTVVLACRDPEDPLCREIVESLKSDTVIISYTEETPEQALLLVKAGKADAAWIFPENMRERVCAFVTAEPDSSGFVQVFEREQTVALGLARERLSGVLFKASVQEAYLNYVRQNAPEAEGRSDEELLSYLHNANVTGKLFENHDIYGNKKTETANYLTTPLRGILAILATVGSIVTAMYYQKDKEKGIFSLLPERLHFLGEFGYQMVSALNLMSVVLLSLIISGLSVNLFIELLLFVLYSLACSLYGMLLRSIFGGGKWLAVCIPVIVLLMLVICPVFFDIAAMRLLQLIFPPTYFVTGAYNYTYLLYLVVFLSALLLAYTAVSLGKKLVRRISYVKG